MELYFWCNEQGNLLEAPALINDLHPFLRDLILRVKVKSKIGKVYFAGQDGETGGRPRLIR